MKLMLMLFRRWPGFTLTELLIVLVIIGILVLLAIPRFQPLITRARSTEARMSLTHLHTLQKSHFLMHSSYSKNLSELGFEQEKLILEGGPANYQVEVIAADQHGFSAKATSVVDFDGDGNFNTWEIDEQRSLREVIPD